MPQLGQLLTAPALTRAAKGNLHSVTRRATLVGEPTGGGAHFGGMVPMGAGYVAFIPVGRTFDPDTGQSWEGVGVKPDVAVPADKALEEALKLAGVKVSADGAAAQLK